MTYEMTNENSYKSRSQKGNRLALHIPRPRLQI